MQRILVTIPHYFGPAQLATKHGSSTAAPASRAAILQRTIMTLHQTFGQQQTMMQLSRGKTDAANQALRYQVAVKLCTDGVHHVTDQLSIASGFFEHKKFHVPAPQLGLCCHELLLQATLDYDWFVYLEDDLLIHDPLLFHKLAWFQTVAGPEAVLQPNRFERSDQAAALKAYVDGDLAPSVTAGLQDITLQTEVTTEVFGQQVRFQRPLNPHSGCFFLTRAQMQRWQQQGAVDRDAVFVGPLESAASLRLMQLFRVYKPALENAAFAEIEHQSTQFISQLRPAHTATPAHMGNNP